MAVSDELYTLVYKAPRNAVLQLITHSILVTNTLLGTVSSKIRTYMLLYPTAYLMHHQFNIQQLYALPTLYLCVLCLSENSDLCHLQHKLIGFYNRDEKCL